MKMHAAILAAALCGTAGAQALCDRIQALTVDPTVAAAHWGVAVTRLDGTPLCGVNEGQLFRPASNNKIFTTATAMAMLGPDRRFETRVTGKLDPTTGVVAGDLTLVGGGDANLDSNDLPYLPASERPKVPRPFAFHNLNDLAAQLVAKGVKSITGDVVGDDTLFPYEPYPPSWNGDDFVWGYGAPVSALTLADNQLKLTITPGTLACPSSSSTQCLKASVVLDQHGIAYYTVLNEVGTVPAKAPAGVDVERLPGSRTIRVYGTIAEDAAPDNEEIAIDDPALYAAMAFREILVAKGITITGHTRAAHRPVDNGAGFVERLHAPPGIEAAMVSGQGYASSCMGSLPGVDMKQPPLAVLGTHASEGLLPDVNLTNKVSQNLHAEIFLHQLGQWSSCKGYANVEGARMIRAYLLHAGVLPADFLLYDGSGLSDHDLCVAPRALAKFLSYAATQPWFAQWKSTLPQGGVDGTLNSRFPALKGRIFAKTGTLGESRALSGYVTTAAGETLIFSVLVDTHLPGSADRVVMDRIVTSVAGASADDYSGH